MQVNEHTLREWALQQARRDYLKRQLAMLDQARRALADIDGADVARAECHRLSLELLRMVLGAA